MDNNDGDDTPSPNQKPLSYQGDEELDVLALLEATNSDQSGLAGVEQEFIASPCASESSKDGEDDDSEYQGEVDEGFDEEFDTEDLLAKEEGDPNNLAPSFEMLNELNEKELQHLLAEDIAMSAGNALSLQNPMLLDDFDLGVDVLDTEHSSHNLLASDPVKSPTPFSCVPPTSPYQLVGTSSPMATTVLAGSSMETLNQMNSYNAFMSTQSDSDNMGMQSEMTSEYAEYQSTASSQGSSHSHSCTDDLDMLYSVMEGDALSTSQTSRTGFSIPSTSAYQHSMFTTSSDVTNSMYNPTLTSVATSQYPISLDSNTLMDLTAASRLVQEDTSNSVFNTSLASSSGLNFMNCTSGGATNVLANGGGGSTNTTSCSKGSQTVSYASSMVQISDTTCLLSSANTNSLSSSPDSPPVRSKPTASTSSLPPSSPISSSYGSPTPSPYSTTSGAYGYSPLSPKGEANEQFLLDFSDNESDTECVPSLPYTNGELICMPFYKFKKLLDSNSISVKDKDLLKAIRRRGKNKVAAKHCRQKKLGAIYTLQMEVDQLKVMKKRLTIRTRSLEQEILSCKQKYSQKPPQR